MISSKRMDRVVNIDNYYTSQRLLHDFYHTPPATWCFTTAARGSRPPPPSPAPRRFTRFF
jgi:hypothetical protein